MIPKDYRQMLKRLAKAGLIVGHEDLGGKHSRLLLRGGAVYACPRSPSDWRAVRNAEAHIKKLTQA